MNGPRVACVRRAAEREKELLRAKRLERTISWSRLGAVAFTLVLAWTAAQAELLPLRAAAVPALIFLFLILAHERVLRRVARLERAHDFYRQALARLDGDWRAGGRDGARFRGECADHIHAVDLDLFGRDSLFRLLCRTRTRAGDELLAAWLLEPASPAVVRQRQEAVAELAPKLDFRERLAVCGPSVRAELDPAALLSWAARTNLRRTVRSRGGRSLLPLRLLLGVVAALNVVTLVGWLGFGWRPSPFLALAVVCIVWGMQARRRLRATLAGVERAGRDLGLLAELIRTIEAEPFESERLRALAADLGRDRSVAASRSARRLERLVELHDSMGNALFAPFGMLVLWAPQVACAMETWRRQHASAVKAWIGAIAEIEVLASFACHSYEHPHDVFPAVVEPAPDGPVFIGRQLGHPLLLEKSSVANDVALATAGAAGGGSPADGNATVVQGLIVTGSNMSGKSTLLRTVGANAVLALAGAPVRAASLRLTPLALGSSIQLRDSLAEGRSRFFAEINTLRAILEQAKGGRTLFLLDELLHGTNSHDRRIGAEAIIRALLDRGAIGLATSHDLALAELADRPDERRLRNVHFQDRPTDSGVSFDYRLREGTVTRSNALELMRQVGIDV